MAPRSHTVFLGCPPDPETVVALSAWQTRLQADLTTGPAALAVRWIRRPALHLTIHYLGTLAAPQIQSVQARVAAILADRAAISCCLGEPGVFPQASRPRGIWVELHDIQGQLRQLHADLYGALLHLKLARLSAHLRPHITIGRLSRSVPRSQQRVIAYSVQTAHSWRPGPSVQGVLDRVHLYESLQRPGGNAYHPLATWPLVHTPA